MYTVYVYKHNMCTHYVCTKTAVLHYIEYIGKIYDYDDC